MVTVISTVNSFPSVSLSYHVASEGAHEAYARDAVEQAAADQARTLRPRYDADESVSISVDGGGSLSFSGFGIAPTHRMGTAGVGNSITLIHEASIISGYLPNVYDDTSEAGVSGDAMGGDRLESTDTKVGVRMADILDKTIAMWQTEGGRIRGTEETEAMKDALHTQNLRMEDKVFRLLQESEADFPGLSVLTEYSNINQSINFQIWKTLFSRRQDFFSTLQAIMAQWNLIYAPSKQAGQVGTLRRMSTILDEAGIEERSVIVQDMTLSTGPRATLPVTQVIVSGIIGSLPSDQDILTSDTVDNVAPKQLATYPPTFIGGRVIEAGMPPFLGMPFRTPTPPGDPGALSVEDYQARAELWQAELNDVVEDLVKKFAGDWAKDLYADVALAGSTAMLIGALDFSWEAGQVYKVAAQGKGGSVLFTGMLNQESHTITTSGGQPHASTTLNFSHVRIKG